MLETPLRAPEAATHPTGRRHLTVARPGHLPALAPVCESDALADVQRREWTYRRVLVLADAASTIIALLIALVILGDDQIRVATLALVPLVVAAAKLSGLYERDELVLRKSTIDELPRLFQLAMLVTFSFWLLSDELMRGMLGQAQAVALWAVLTLSLLTSRALARLLAGRVSPVERVLVVGDDAILRRLGAELTSDSRVELVGSVPFDSVAFNSSALADRAREAGAHRLIVAPGDGAVASPEALQVIRAAKRTGLRVSLLPGVLDVVGTAVEFDSLSGMTLLGVRRYGLSRSSRWSKRVFDVSTSVIGGVLVAPLLALIAIAIKLDSPGPLLFRQPRVGRDGELFEIIKFRSMVAGADALQAGLVGRNEAPDGLFKIAGDPRITVVGRFLRRTSMDELPQLLNVLRGEMSLIGPRPLVADEDRHIVGHDRRRLDLTPGMTGPWQIAGSARVPISEMVKLDYLYVVGWSLWSDVKILIRTALYVAGRHGQ